FACCLVSYDMLSVHFFLYYTPPTPEIYTLSLHDALPIFAERNAREVMAALTTLRGTNCNKLLGDASNTVERIVADASPRSLLQLDRKSTRLNSSHQIISYAVFCLKKKKSNTMRDNNTHIQ